MKMAKKAEDKQSTLIAKIEKAKDVRRVFFKEAKKLGLTISENQSDPSSTRTTGLEVNHWLIH